MSATTTFATMPTFQTAAQPQAPVKEMKKTKQAKVQTEAKKPVKYISDFTSKYIAVKRLGKNSKGKVVIKKHAPRIIAGSLNSIDKKALEFDNQIQQLKTELANIDPQDAKSRLEINKKLEVIKEKRAKLYEGAVDINSFAFIRDFEAAKGDASKVSDPELRGYLEILSKNSEGKLLRSVDENVLKVLIDRFGFESDISIKQYAKMFDDILKDSPSVRTLIFNNVFDHPYMLDKNGNKVVKKIGKKNATEDYQLSYLTRSYDRLDAVLASLVKDVPEQNIINGILDLEIKEQKFNDVTLQTVYQKFVGATGDQKQFVKGLTKSEKVLYALYQKYTNLIKVLKTYELKKDFNAYAAAVTAYDQVKTSVINDSSVQAFLESVVMVLANLHKIPIKTQAVSGQKFADGIDCKILDRFFKTSKIQLGKDAKSKLLQCAQTGAKLEFVEQKRDENTKKLIALNFNQFKIDDINNLETDKDMYSADRFAKLGTITELQTSKIQRIALGLRLVSELKGVIAEGQLSGQTVFNIMA